MSVHFGLVLNLFMLPKVTPWVIRIQAPSSIFGASGFYTTPIPNKEKVSNYSFYRKHENCDVTTTAGGSPSVLLLTLSPGSRNLRAGVLRAC